jgi:hypothetical protein
LRTAVPAATRAAAAMAMTASSSMVDGYGENGRRRRSAYRRTLES